MRARALGVTSVTALVLIVAAGCGGHSSDGSPRARAPSTPTAEAVAVGTVGPGPRIVFRSTVPGPEYGRVAMVGTDSPGGPRQYTRATCDRVAASGRELVCLRAATGTTSSYTATVWRGGTPVSSVQRPGVPSRARLSPGGTLTATTGFVDGDSYETTGFSTRTFITPVGGGRGMHLQDFQLVHRGQAIAPTDRNYWGVTFLDEDAFYVTASFDGHTWLARGSVRARRIWTTPRTAECPSVSPDHTHVAYKKKQHDGTWRIAVLDVASSREQLLPGDRSVDDQVAWLGNATILYTLPRSGADSGQSDVWAVSADGSSAPRLLIKEAGSPTVVEQVR